MSGCKKRREWKWKILITFAQMKATGKPPLQISVIWTTGYVFGCKRLSFQRSPFIVEPCLHLPRLHWTLALKHKLGIERCTDHVSGFLPKCEISFGFNWGNWTKRQPASSDKADEKPNRNRIQCWKESKAKHLLQEKHEACVAKPSVTCKQ